MEDAYDNVQHGHATHECAEILIEELQQYDTIVFLGARVPVAMFG